MPRGRPLPARRSCRRTTSRRRRGCMPTDDPQRMDPELDHGRPRQPQQALRHARRDPPDRRRRRVPRGPRALRAQHRLRLRAAGRLRGRRRRQPARPAGRRARHRLLAQGRAVRAHLRRVQHPDHHVLRRARLPARHRAGVGRDHPPRRQAAVRLRRGDGPEDHGHHPQGLRRRLRRHGLQAHAAPTSTSPGRRPRSR